MQFLNIKDYLGTKPIASSKFEVDIIYVDGRFFTMPSLSHLYIVIVCLRHNNYNNYKKLDLDKT